MQDTSEREEGETDDKKREKGGGWGEGRYTYLDVCYVTT